MHLRGKESAMGHIFLVFIFLGISKNYINDFKVMLYFSLICLMLNAGRYICTNLYLKNPIKNYYSIYLNFLTVGSGAIWGLLFSLVYLKFGLYKAPSLCLYIIVAGIASGATSSLYAKKTILFSFLFFVLIVPGCLIAYNEIAFNEKLFGLLIMTYFAFLFSQSKINRNNLISRLQLSYTSLKEVSRIEQLFNSVPGIFCYIDTKGAIMVSNHSWKNFSKDFGNNENFYHGMDSDFIVLIDDFINSQEENLSTEFKFISLPGEPVFICNTQKISSTAGVILFMLDITAQKLSQYQMKLKDAHFQHAARLIELGEVVGSIAHEINNPLSVVIGRTQVNRRMLKANVLDLEKLTSNMEVIELSASRIAKLVSGMKSLVRNAEADPATDQSFAKHLEIVQFLIKNKAETKNVNFELVTLTTDLNGFCRPSQIEQVLINLVNNAIDAAADTEDRWTKLIISSNSNYLIFEVIDSGKGISEELLSKIWNPFFTTKEIGKGTGLGLSISHSIIHDNNGHFYYKTGCENTTFVVEIPKIKIAA